VLCLALLDKLPNFCLPLVVNLFSLDLVPLNILLCLAFAAETLALLTAFLVLVPALLLKVCALFLAA